MPKVIILRGPKARRFLLAALLLLKDKEVMKEFLVIEYLILLVDTTQRYKREWEKELDRKIGLLEQCKAWRVANEH